MPVETWHQPPNSLPMSTIPIAILFAYNGYSYDGLERKSSEKSIEALLFKAIAKQYSEQISMTHISRAKVTYDQEHAGKQVISVNLGGSDKLPDVSLVNKELPNDIKVFKIIKVHSEFSARRNCEARTIEFVIPVECC